MTLNQASMAAMLESAAELLLDDVERLNVIDSRFGDGDHGVTIGKIAKLILERTSQWGEQSIREFLNDLGTAVMEVRGGSAGPLYGTLLGGLGARLGDEENELEADGVKRMFAGALEEMEGVTTAKVGDKTMMDALIPAVQAAQEAQGDAKDVLAAAAAAGMAGAKASEGFIAKFGRARSYKEQTIGTPDVGAVSTSLFIRGLAEGSKKARGNAR